MNPQNISSTPELPVKRKRGRPRKDETIQRNDKLRTQPPPQPLVLAPPPPPQPAAINPPPPPVIPVTTNVSKVDHNLVGQAVTCVIDGIFDNGYLLSTRMGPNNSILRGIVFQQGHVSPLTPENDVAPHVEMTTRIEFPIPPANPTNNNQIQLVCTQDQSVCAKQPTTPVPLMQNYQTAPPMVVTGGGGSSSNCAPPPQQQPQPQPPESLRLVEQDDVMQVFEVSKTVEEQEPQQECDQTAKNDHMVSDPTAESFPENNTVIQGVQMQHESDNNRDPPLSIATESQPVVNYESPVKENDVVNPEVITDPVETVMEDQPLAVNDGLQQEESKEQTGEASNVDANQDPTQDPIQDQIQDPNQEVAVDLSLSNFPEI